MRSLKAKITKSVVDKLETGQTIWDIEIKGFMCDKAKSGRITYRYKYNVKHVKPVQQRKYTIGAHGSLTPAEARDIAKQLAVEVAQGKDPAKDRKTERATLTFKQLSDRFLIEHAKHKKKEASAKNDKGNLNNHILPRLGKKLVKDITRADVDKLHSDMKETP
ncbi:MAG: integrase arm-type DNA-binding domain-containing protein, partial [Alphaproteobacteria bacterium]|nr:integrase arm-type DNA-binding domain-containing protein [Alphaproteobacteria bacterium]